MNYEGRCIGGPRAGQMLAHSSAVYQVRVFERPLPLSVVDALEAGLPHSSLYTYEWHQVLTNQGTAGVWCANETDVLAVLLESYAAAHRARAADERGA